jgi:hypothetical protein
MISIKKAGGHKPIRVIGTRDTGGYGQALRGLLQALAAVGYGPDVVRFVPAITTSMAVGKYDDEDAWMEPYFIGDRTEDEAINIVHLNPALVGIYHTAGRYNIAYCAWETDSLPKKEHDYHGVKRTVVDCLNDYDEIWVPSTFLVDVFKQSGVTAPIYVVPHALQESLLALPPRNPAPLKGDAQTVFYNIGSWNPRKNTQGVVRAYWSCGWQPTTDPVRMMLHQVPSNRTETAILQHQHMMGEELSVLRDGYKQEPGVGALLTTHTSPKPYSWILKLHQQSHILVSASCGEGYGLGIPGLEALGLGNYLVGGGGPALEDLAKVVPGSVTVLPYRKAPVVPMMEGFELTQQWWEIENTQDLIEEMKALHSFVQLEGMPEPADVEKVRDLYCPKTIGECIKKRLEHAYNEVE